MNRDVVLIGAGKIARGYVGQLFSAEGWRVTYVHHRMEFVRGLRNRRYYTLYQHDHDGGCKTLRMEGYDVLCSVEEREAYLDALARAQYAGVVTFPGAFDGITADLAAAVRLRMERGVEEPLAILLCVNTVDPAEFFYNRISEYLDESARAYFDRHVGLVETLVTRLCSTPSPEQLLEDPYAVSTSDTPILEVDREAFLPGHSYPEFFLLGENVPGKLVKKIWCGNLEHCCLAYYGQYFGHGYVHEAARDPYVRRCTYYAGQEANRAVAAAYGFSPEEMAFDVPAKWRRSMKGLVPDPLTRVGADPVRKLGKNDRFIGPALLSLRQGNLPVFIAKGAACGFYFHNPEDAGARTVQAHIQERGIGSAIQTFCGLDPAHPQEGLLYQLILSAYEELSQFDPAAG